MTNCPRAGKLFGCRFRSRYDLGPATPNFRPTGDCSEHLIEAMLRLSRPQTYVRDVCERCGKTIEREGKQ